MVDESGWRRMYLRISTVELAWGVPFTRPEKPPSSPFTLARTHNGAPGSTIRMVPSQRSQLYVSENEIIDCPVSAETEMRR